MHPGGKRHAHNRKNKNMFFEKLIYLLSSCPDHIEIVSKSTARFPKLRGLYHSILSLLNKKMFKISKKETKFSSVN